MNTNPAPERTWSLSSKEVKALSHASGSDYVYALTEDEVSGYMYSYPCYPAVVNAFTSKAVFQHSAYPFTSLLLQPSSTTLPQVHRLPVEECSNFTDCSACITNGGLLCGWCSVENKCSRRPQCANSNSSDGLRWVQTTDRCLTVDNASAVSISGEETAYPIETRSIVSRG